MTPTVLYVSLFPVGASSTVSTDSGVWTGGEGGSPTARRRPRNLEMVMKGAHSFHLRELNMDDLDILGKSFFEGRREVLIFDPGLQIRTPQGVTITIKLLMFYEQILRGLLILNPVPQMRTS